MSDAELIQLCQEMSGELDCEECPTCGGTGETWCEDHEPNDCPDCNGVGFTE